MDSDLEDALKDFLVESFENMDQLDRDLVALEKEPGSSEILARVFRTIHTIKGTCGFLGFGRLESVTHVGENLLSRLRDGDLRLDPEITSALLGMVDAVRHMLVTIEATGGDGDGDYSALLATLTRLHQGERLAAPLAGSAPPPPLPTSTPLAAPAVSREPLVSRAPAAPSSPGLATGGAASGGAASGGVASGGAASGGAASGGAASGGAASGGADSGGSGEPAQSGASAAVTAANGPSATAIAATPHASPAPAATPRAAAPPEEAPAPSYKEAPPPPQQEGGHGHGAISDSTIRVDVVLLDKLMNLVGELVLARNQVLQYTASQRDTAFTATSQRLNLITTELQEGVMKTRMQPIGNIWGKFPRVVRDLATSCGKQVEIEMQGKQTELDKTIIEAIKDPLTHLIRNSVDHGIERPEVRSRAGKPAVGQLLLRAFHEGGQVNIEISDDGAGIDPDKIKRKAMERGLISKEVAGRMSDRDAIHMIFLAGFSTAEKVTSISGRGVGMDVVKTNIERIGGTVDVQSRLGKGSTFKIKIPLTLAIIPALIITCGGDRYAIPQVSLLELVRLEGERARRGIEHIHGAPVYRLRGNLLPLVYLHRELCIPEPLISSGDQDVLNIVVVQAGDRQFGVIVATINDTEEIVVKPLGQQLKGLQCYAGATIMGDGKVALILDVLGIAQRAGVVTAGRDRPGEHAAPGAAVDGESERETLLLFQASSEARMAIPLSLVARLEEFPKTQIEHAGGYDVVQYRSSILPLIRLCEVLPVRGGKSREDAESLQVVVYSQGGVQMGLVVDRIVDIVQEAIKVRLPSNRPGIASSVVIQGRVTELLDVESVIRDHGPPWAAAGLDS